ncbi:DNA integrity scanning protein DisA nucleotide-binding domain protein [Haloarcula sp. 1CSR25-25]|uniref:DNA integrity scanning protein DisA nucleotide-binding domain protein n=1 Tax=Haloarcula sp. 1CSR25-25 TaxID=2862545 RepID=UPI002894A435|nr:DNA integrity scanning protein DisA nucleotide-binding domain protein [Haloarcula sp. 1CSR25-25]MDT3433661.1 DNA integrity scanning protein DisA nucleotide-binding domain protein [Haloarcula sp. 1CSR25-25]
MSDSTERQRSADTDGEAVPENAVLDRIRGCVESVSLAFERWDDPHVRGPGLYVVVERDSTAAFSDPIGVNRWPVEDCRSVFGHSGALFETARSVADTCDGAVVVRRDGTIRPAMVRLRQLTTAEEATGDPLPYADWMGTRHMSALETSTRDAVFAVVTLSEENGRVTVFRDGDYDDRQRDELVEKR